MNNIMTRVLTVIMLIFFSMGVYADVKILFGEKGEELKTGETQIKGDNGTIAIEQKASDDGSQTTVYLTFTPETGFTISSDNIEVYAVISPSSGSTRSPEISGDPLKLNEEDSKDPEKRYSINIDSNLGVWVKSANFQEKKRNDGAKGGTPVGTDYSGYFFIANKNGYNASNKPNNYYLIPSIKDYFDANCTQPFLTTYKSYNLIAYPSNMTIPNGNNQLSITISTEGSPEDHSLWEIIFATTENNTDYWYLKHVSSSMYLAFNTAPYNSNTDRARVHLETKPENSTDDKWLFSITAGDYSATNPLPLAIKPKGETKSLNPAKENKNYPLGVNEGNPGNITVSYNTVYGNKIYFGGIVGYYYLTKPDDNKVQAGSHWLLETPVCETPVISYEGGGTISISTTTPGATIYYTMGESPNAPTGTETTHGEAGTSTATFSITEATTIKAIAVKDHYTNSTVAEKSIAKVATPVIAENSDHAISITCATEGATIYYTIDGTDPPTASSEYTAPLTDASNKPIRAIAVKDQYIDSDESSATITLHCAKPVITKEGMTYTITCAFPTGATIYYSSDGSEPTTPYGGSAIAFTDSDLPFTIQAIAKKTDYTDSEIGSKYFGEELSGEGTSANPYLIKNAQDFEVFVDILNGDGDKRDKYFKIDKANVNNGEINVSDCSAINSGVDFSGTFDGEMVTLSGLGHPLFNSINGGTVKNVILDNVSISGGTNAGAICNEATGNTRIYNCGVLASESTVMTDDDGYTEITSCSSTISGSGYVGGIVGLLDGSSRVINCYSYANITGGNLVGGIVGKNNVATNANSEDTEHYLKTMVMNCMFYGDIDDDNCTSIAPVYNGEIITNRSDANGVSNFNYFWAGASYVQGQHIDIYNCALSAETRYLQRFEFFRHLLNSNRELAAWWATGDIGNKDEMMKWVMEPSQIGTSTPYPILKTPGKYPSVVNIDAVNAEAFSGDADIAKTQYNQGREFGSFTINMRMGSDGDGDIAPTGASIQSSVTRKITDKDPKHFNFNYYKVQLPYYNEVGTKNYTDNKVVTGWKIVTISGGTHEFSTGSDASASVSTAENTKDDITLTTPYNFADRKSTAKDLYSDTNKRVFSQGAYFDIPEGVTSITIEPYWGKCVYVSDEYPDVVYSQDMKTPSNVTTVGGGSRYTNENNYDINDNSQNVYTSMANAVTALNPSGTVYDNAIVLVGNVHSLDISNKTSSKPYTIMSIDLDKDNEPDYSYILRFNDRVRVHPVRVDFLNVIGLGMAQKSHEGQGTYNFGIMQPLNWFEVTNTGLFRVTQFEYDKDGRTGGPMILHGGVIEQWVTVAETSNPPKEANAVDYYHVGSNVWFKEFHLGAHQDRQAVYTPHPPISVTGGDFDEFYLTGLYNTPTDNFGDNAECYINGGRFGKVAGTGMQGIGKTGGADNTGNIIWQIDNADIDEFYAGGINAAHKAEGNIWTVISNSRVDQFCGGPKFGDMNNGKVVVTNATNCTFRTFFGAGYGGNSYNREYPTNKYNDYNYGWNAWLKTVYTNEYKSNYGVATRIDYQFIPKSDNEQNVARLFVDYVSFSLATTHNVTSKLTGCTITKRDLGRLDLFSQCIGNFYGGGSLGKVDGPVKSTLIDCTVEGNAFGAGYSATLPTVSVMDNKFQPVEPSYDTNSGSYLLVDPPATIGKYSWEHRNETINSTNLAIDKQNNILYTNEDLTALGKVTGTATLNIEGSTTVAGNVYGGGEESNVEGNTEITMSGGTIGYGYSADVEHGNVFGGGKGSYEDFECVKAMVGENNAGKDKDPGSNDYKDNGTKVNITNGTVNRNVYGGGELGRVEWNTQVMIGAESGTSTPVIHGNVFGAGAGKETHGYSALVRGNSTVTVQANAKVLQNVYGGGEKATVGRYWVKGVNNIDSEGNPVQGAPTAPNDLPIGMPYKQQSGGICTVTIQGQAQIGPDDGGTETAGHVFGAGKGVVPGTYDFASFSGTNRTSYPKRMALYDSEKYSDDDKKVTWEYVDPDNTDTNLNIWEYFDTEDKYLTFLQTLSLATNSNVTIDGSATVKGNVYGGSESGFVQHDTSVEVNGSNCVIGTSTTNTYGDVYGGGKGLAEFFEAGKVKGNTILQVNNGTIYGTVYGGGELGYVGQVSVSSDMRTFTWTDSEGNANTTENANNKNTGVCNVTITNGTVNGHVFGAGKGKEDSFWCEKGIVYSTNVSISAGTVNHNVYGGGKVGRVETDTKVKIGPDSGTGAPEIKGDVFGAGAGVETHGYSALVRGNTTVTVQGSAKVDHNVYGGGEIAAVGKYYLVDQAYLDAHPGTTLEEGMPYSLVDENLGVCNVTIKGSAVIGYNNGTGHVFGGGKGKEPTYYLGSTDSYSSNDDRPYRMMSYNSNHYNDDNNNPLKGLWAFSDASEKYVWEYFDTRAKYHTFLQTLALATRTVVSVEGEAHVNGSVYGGSESGFVQHNTSVTIKGESTIGIDGEAETDGNVFGGGLGLDIFAEAGRVSGNATVNVYGGTVWRNVYGGGSLGPVGNYYYEVNETTHSKTYTWTEGGTCNVNIDELDGKTTLIKGSVYGAGKGSNAKYECEPAMALQSNVTINDGTVNGTVYGGGEVGRVDKNTMVTIGKTGDDSKEPDIKGDVFGAGAGVDTHGYSALVRGNATVTIQGKAKVGKNVYGGGKTASVGRFVVDAETSLPTSPVSGGICAVSILGQASIGYDGGGDVYGACKGVEPGDWSSLPGHVTAVSDEPTKFTREADYLHFLKTLALTSNTEVTIGGSSTVNGSVYGGGQRGITLAGVKVDMTGGTVNKDVYGGGALADTNTENWDDTNKTLTRYHEETRLTRPSYQVKAVGAGESVEGLYIYDEEAKEYKAASDVADSETTYYEKVDGSPVAGYYTLSGGKYTLLTSGTADESTTYYRFTDTKVNLLGGLIKGDAYGGGLGKLGAAVDGVHYTQDEADAYNTENSLSEGDEGYKTTDDWKTEPVAASEGSGAVKAMVYGDVFVNQGTADDEDAATAYTISYLTDNSDPAKQVVNSGRIFGCNNLNGSPMGNVTVTVNGTKTGKDANGKDITRTTINPDPQDSKKRIAESPHTYEVAAVYGGGNLADYTPVNGDTKVRINSCNVSIEEVYGGGNAAKVPSTDVLVMGAHQIEQVFGGGNGADKYFLNDQWHENPGADVGGNANTLLRGGLIHEAYGGSNEKGTITGNITIDTGKNEDSNYASCTPVQVDKLVGAGKNADVNGNLIMIMGCKDATKIPIVYGGADNANVRGHVELTITSGHFGQVFGGNNEGGAIFGHIILNIEETSECEPIRIDELYLGGNNAAYSKYGYYVKTTTSEGDGTGVGAPSETAVVENERLVFMPRQSAGDRHKPVKNYEKVGDTWTWTIYEETEGDTFTSYDEPKLNVISATSIGKVFGGGWGAGGDMYANPTVNINMIPGVHAEAELGGANRLGAIGDVYGGGDAADVIGNTTVNIGTATTVTVKSMTYDSTTNTYTEGTANVLGANITGNVFGGGNEANVTGDTHVNICGTQVADQTKENGYTDTAVDHSGTTDFNVSIGNSVYGGGSEADVLGNTFVTMADGYIFNGIFGGGLAGSVGTFENRDFSVTKWNHTAHDGCIGMPKDCKDGTGTCYVVVSGGQIGPLEVATKGMNRKTSDGYGDPVPQGWVWGAGCGRVENPADDQDTHFKTYVNNTDVTIKNNAFILESIIGGGEFGRVLNNTLVKIEGGQIGVGYDPSATEVEPYDDDAFVDPTTTTITSGEGGNALTPCSTFPYTSPYNPYDPFADEYKRANGDYLYQGGSTDNACDGKTWIGCVFAGGSGYMPYRKENATTKKLTDYDWVSSAGWVGHDAEVRISGGHILTNVYGGNEYTDVNGKCIVTMTGGTVGVPRTVDQILANPMIGHIFGAGKGDPRVHFNKVTNVGDVEINISGGTVYGSVFGGGEDGHVLRNVTMTIEGDAKIGTWGTTYIDGNVFGGGRGYSGDAYTAGNVAGCVEVEIKGGNILGSVYGGGQLGSVGYDLLDAGSDGYGEMQADVAAVDPVLYVEGDDLPEGKNVGDVKTPGSAAFKRGHIDLTISGGTIGNSHEYIYPKTGSGGNIPSTISETDFTKWSDANWTTWKNHNNIPKTEFDTSTGRVSHTKGGNVFAGGMGRMYQLDGTTPISAVDWWKMGCVKSTKLTISGEAKIKSTVFGGGELGQVVGYHTAKNAADEDVNVGTEVIINGGTIGTEIQESVTTGTGESATTTNYTRFIYGSVFGGGYGSLVDELVHDESTDPKKVSYPKYIAGRVKAGTKVEMAAGSVMASVYGGGKMAAVGESKTLGEDLTIGHTGDTHVIISGGTIGKSGFGGAKVGNVYGGGSGHNNTVRSGHIYGNTNVTISGTPIIYHNVYGGGAYGSVGDFTYSTAYDAEAGANKVSGISNLDSDHTNSGVARVSITGGTIGTNGKENGMVFGSSRGDINEPGRRDDYTAWVYDTHVTIGTSASGTEGQEGYVAESGPDIKGSVYGSGENGHTFNNAVVTINGGTIGIADSSDPGYKVTSNGTEYSGAAYPYRGNVYGGGCGTDKYYTNHDNETHDGNGQLFNPLAGIVYGNATVNINGGTVVRNVYGAGAMGSVGRLVTTSTTEDETTTTTTSTTGGTTTINISGGTIGVSGTVGDGNVFGAARGDNNAKGNDLALVRLANVKETSVTISNDAVVKGNVYGGGEVGSVGTYSVSTEGTDYMKNYTFENGTGACSVTINGGTIGTGVDMNDDGTFANGNVYGASKGLANTFWCEKGMVYSTTVAINAGTVNGTVYGGGQIGRVEHNAAVTIGVETPADNTVTPSITGNVFGAGAGLETHGYSALLRGDTEVTVQGYAHIGGSVYGGGEKASVGRFKVPKGVPTEPDGGGNCTVNVQGNASIAGSVFGTGQGVTPRYYTTVDSYGTTADMPKRMMAVTMGTFDDSNKDYWEYVSNDDQNNVWEYLNTKPKYLSFLETLALASHPEVTIDGNAAVSGSVYGGGQRGITLGTVAVNMNGGTVTEDVYGGGALADTNKGNWDATANNGAGDWAQGKTSSTYTTTVNLKGGVIGGDAYGGGLGQLEEKTGEAITKPAVEAKVYGNVVVKLNEPKVTTQTTGEGENASTTTTTTYGDCVVKGNIFGCNNLNGSPQSTVTVHVYKTEGWEGHEGTSEENLNSENASDHSYHLKGVYGGGNLSAFNPDLETTRDTVQAYVIIDGCDQTSIKQVYGGGNAASTPATNVTINASYEIEEVFGGGNGKDKITINNVEKDNPGANVGYVQYPTEYDIPASSKEERKQFSYGSGKASVTIYDGLIHRVFGGSNTKGNVRESAVTLLDDMKGCHFQVDEAYGGGKNAPMDAEAKLLMACIPGLKVAYGGAQEADVLGGVTLTITNGTYERVFGGNNISGTIQGPIVVNIEETGCKPIVIGELYGGGNLAGYSVYGYESDRTPKESGTKLYDDPVVNVKSFTSIGDIYGGGYGLSAKMVGNPTVNINVAKGKYAETYNNSDNVIGEYARVVGSSWTTDTTVEGYGSGYPIPSHAKGAIGAINTVFGGGNAAPVVGNPNVNIGTRMDEEEYMAVVEVATTAVTEADGYYIRSEKGTAESPYTYTLFTGTPAANTTYYKKYTIEGADIRGNVYGGGNNADVTGNTNVVIGKEKVE